jgi:chorismate mutase
MKPPHSKTKNPRHAIDQLRAELRTIDDQLMLAVKRRMQLAKAIGDEKAELGLKILDTDRESVNRKQNRTFADDVLPVAMVDELTDFLTGWSRKIQEIAQKSAPHNSPQTPLKKN